MSNLFDFDGVTVDQDLLERTNPIFNTAKMTLFQLAAAGYEDAQAVADSLNLTREETQDSKSVKLDESYLLSNSIIMEVRYFTNGKLAKESGFTEVDLPCGYTPRAIEFAKCGKKFVGLDLPATINEVEPAIMSLLDDEQKKLVGFEGVDATNYQSLKKAFDKIDGKVCITTEGLIMYLNQSEMDAMCDNIKSLLAEHGGCWITLDPEISFLYIAILKAFFGDKTREMMYKNKDLVEDKSDVKIATNKMLVSAIGDIEENMKNAIKYVKSKGFKLERLPFSEHVPELKSFEKADPEVVAKIKESFKRVCIWKMSLDESASVDSPDSETGEFEAKAVVDGSKLKLTLSGSLDTLSAPKLLANYENIKENNKLETVDIDCVNLNYVSSAGLRVLLIMENDCEGGVTMKSCNESVVSILEQTGFDAILSLEDQEGDL